MIDLTELLLYIIGIGAWLIALAMCTNAGRPTYAHDGDNDVDNRLNEVEH